MSLEKKQDNDSQEKIKTLAAKFNQQDLKLGFYILFYDI